MKGHMVTKLSGLSEIKKILLHSDILDGKRVSPKLVNRIMESIVSGTVQELEEGELFFIYEALGLSRKRSEETNWLYDLAGSLWYYKTVVLLNTH